MFKNNVRKPFSSFFSNKIPRKRIKSHCQECPRGPCGECRQDLSARSFVFSACPAKAFSLHPTFPPVICFSSLFLLFKQEVWQKHRTDTKQELPEMSSSLNHSVMLSSNIKYFSKVDSKHDDTRKKFLAQLLGMTSLSEKFTLHSMTANLFW